MSIKLMLALISCFFCINVQAASLCEIDHVENFNGDIKVVFNKSANLNIRGIKRAGSQKIEPLNAGAALILKEGDESGVYLGPHDFCTLKAEKKEKKLGVSANANNHIPGVPATDRSEFILPTK